MNKYRPFDVAESGTARNQQQHKHQKNVTLGFEGTISKIIFTDESNERCKGSTRRKKSKRNSPKIYTKKN